MSKSKAWDCLKQSHDSLKSSNFPNNISEESLKLFCWDLLRTQSSKYPIWGLLIVYSVQWGSMTVFCVLITWEKKWTLSSLWQRWVLLSECVHTKKSKLAALGKYKRLSCYLESVRAAHLKSCINIFNINYILLHKNCITWIYELNFSLRKPADNCSVHVTILLSVYMLQLSVQRPTETDGWSNLSDVWTVYFNVQGVYLFVFEH